MLQLCSSRARSITAQLIRRQRRPHLRTPPFSSSAFSTCPKCQDDGAAAAAPCSFICPTCNTIKDVSTSCNNFDLLGLPTSFNLDPNDMDAAYKALQKKLHPDLHHQSPDTAELAASHSTRINMACDILSDPVLRAQHLMVIKYNEDPLAEGTPSLNDPELLMFVMEARQAIEDVATEDAAVLYNHHQEMMNNVVDEMRKIFDNSTSKKEEQTKMLIKLQYVSKMMEEISGRTPVM